MASPDHVALVVPQLETTLERLGDVADQAGPIEEFPSEAFMQ